MSVARGHKPYCLIVVWYMLMPRSVFVVDDASSSAVVEVVVASSLVKAFAW